MVMPKFFPSSIHNILIVIIIVIISNTLSCTEAFTFSSSSLGSGGEGKGMFSTSMKQIMKYTGFGRSSSSNVNTCSAISSNTRLFSHATLQSTAADKKLGVLLLNLGGPEKLEDVEGFLFNLFADPDIIRLPKFLSFLQKPIAFFISKTRSFRSRKAYASIGGGSPIVKYTREQTALLQSALSNMTGYEDTKCYFAMRYWYPFTEEVLTQMKSDGIEKLVILPLYPHYSISTSGSSFRILKEIFHQPNSPWNPEKIPQTVIPYWYHRTEYIHTMSKLIVEKILEYTPQELASNNEELHVLFSAHGVPEYYITRENDPYQLHIQECVQAIEQQVRQLLIEHQQHQELMNNVEVSIHKENLVVADGTATPAPAVTTPVTGKPAMTAVIQQKKLQFHLSFQSRVGPIKWLQPYTEDMLEKLGEEQGVKNLVVIPISFVSEHIETLEEIDQEYQELAHENGITNWKRVPALNLHPDFIATLKNVVVDAIEKFPIVTLEEAMNLSQMSLYKQNR